MLRRSRIGRAVGRAVLLVELVGELVEDDVVAVPDVRRPQPHVVPGEDDHAVLPRLAEPALHPFEDEPAPDRLDGLRHVGARVDEDRREPPVVVGLAVEQQQARLGGDGRP